MSIKLICERDEFPSGLRYTPVKNIAIEVDGDATISEMLSAYADFLRAIGYHFDGELDIVNDFDNGV